MPVKEAPIPVSFFVEPGLREELAELARGNDRTLSAEIRRALRAYLAQKNTDTTSSKSR